MASQPERVILTYDDYSQLPDDGQRYELFEGVLEVTPSPNTAHQTVVINLVLLLGIHVRQHRLGKVFVTPYDVLLSEITVLQPDLLFASRERRQIITPQHVRGAPDLVVEVLSPATAHRDRQSKQQLYARYGVAHYWIVDPERRELAVHALEGDAYRQVSLARNDEEITAPPFPNLTIPLTDLWE
jgi:Uma2 family endonuclease